MRTVINRIAIRPAVMAMWIGAGSLLAATVPASAALDLLKVPARSSPLAAKGMMLALADNGERLIAAGERGLIIFSDDQGKTWQQAAVPVSVTLTTLSFASRDIGWAGGHDGVILVTYDGGKSWRKQFDGNTANALVKADLETQVAEAQSVFDKATPKARDAALATLDALQASLDDVKAGAEFGPSRPILGLSFQDTAEGLAVGSFGQVFRTRDGGKTWESLGGRINNPEGFHYNRIDRLADGSLMITGESGKLRRSRDGGTSWETLDTGYAGHLYGTLLLPNSRVLLTYGFAGNVFRSDDDGKTWAALPRLTNKAIIGGSVLPDGSIILLASNRQQLVSRDQGQKFSLTPAQPGRPVAALLGAPKNGNALVAAGVGGVSFLTVETSSR